MPWIKSGVNRFVPSAIWQPDPPLERTVAELGRDEVVLDLGAGGRQVDDRIVAVDFIAFPNTDVISDVHTLAFADASVDTVICTGTLEHVRDPARVMDEIARVLKPGGRVHLEVPFMQPYHADPVDYWRWTLPGLRLFATERGFEEERSGAHLGPASALNEILAAYARSFFRGRVVRKLAEIVMTVLFFWHKYLDRFLANRTLDMPSGVYFVGRKAGSRAKGATLG